MDTPDLRDALVPLRAPCHRLACPVVGRKLLYWLSFLIALVAGAATALGLSLVGLQGNNAGLGGALVAIAVVMSAQRLLGRR